VSDPCRGDRLPSVRDSGEGGPAGHAAELGIG
jgi:hypothetical protein